MPDTSPIAALLVDARWVAALLDCSPRHVVRLSQSGGMPPPLRLGSLVRWRRSDVERWLADGCPRSGGRRAAR